MGDTETDATKVKRLSRDEELLDIKPSTELIPDEYEHTGNKDFLIHIFQDVDKQYEKISNTCVLNFEKIGYNIPQENIHCMEDNNSVLETLDKISEETKGKSGLLLIFCGEYSENAKTKFLLGNTDLLSTKKIWIKFMASKCVNLRNKPKIFIFLGSKYEPPTTYDSVRNEINAAYNTPAEADILLIYKHAETKGEALCYIEELCKNIEKYSKREDVINIVACTDSKNDERPVLISTLTRKFYFAVSDNRSDNLDLIETQMLVKRELKILHDKFKVKFDKNNHSKVSSSAKVSKTNGVKKTFPIKEKEKANGNMKFTTTKSSDASLTTTDGGSSSKTVAKKNTKEISKKPPWR